jgi:hypothetical protein
VWVTFEYLSSQKHVQHGYYYSLSHGLTLVLFLPMKYMLFYG